MSKNAAKQNPFFQIERVAQIKRQVEDAVHNQKVFLINGCYLPIRKALGERGWLEKTSQKEEIRLRVPLQINKSKPLTVAQLYDELPKKDCYLSLADYVKYCENYVKARVLADHPANFYWHVCLENRTWLEQLPPHVLYNHFINPLFVSKAGLSHLLQGMHWFNNQEMAYTQAPRSYDTAIKDQYVAFVEDYRITACMSLLRTFLHRIATQGVIAVRSTGGTLQICMVKFAIQRCRAYTAKRSHEDIDGTERPVEIGIWTRFLKTFHQFVYKNQKFIDQNNVATLMLQDRAEIVLQEMALVWPQYAMDGHQNLWIIKPGSNSRGTGIQILKYLHEISPMFRSNCVTVVQKYIETPLLVHNTKFDIRQWFLVTSVEPLTIWMYIDSYLRFCSRKFTLLDLDESIHITNYSVQRKYHTKDHAELPADNMWDSNKFKAYLTTVGCGDKWDTTIYPAMKQAIIGAMLASQSSLKHRTNSFALYGADFLISEDFSVWLLEINASPQMITTSKVTGEMCPKCLEDLIKVVVDFPKDPAADTGRFEIIFNAPKTPVVADAEEMKQLTITGTKVDQTPVVAKILDPEPVPVKKPKTEVVNKIKRTIYKARKPKSLHVIISLHRSDGISEFESVLSKISLNSHQLLTRVLHIQNDSLECVFFRPALRQLKSRNIVIAECKNVRIINDYIQQKADAREVTLLYHWKKETDMIKAISPKRKTVKNKHYGYC